jgi:signal peptidase I
LAIPLRAPGRKARHSSFIELVLIVAAALILALAIQAFVVKPYRIPSESMEPTLIVGQRVLVNRVSYRFSDPDKGDIVVFHPPAGADANTCGIPHPGDQPCPRPTSQRSGVNFIKRVVAVPGDTLSIKQGHAVVNGKVQKEGFIRACQGTEECTFPKAIKIPPDHFFMMGDNRGESDDSRFWGPVPKKWIIGQAFSTYWPPRRVGIL